MASSADKFLYFLVGGFIGAAVGLLMAPRSGQETRDLLEGKYRDGTERLNQRVREGRHFVNQKSKEVTEKVSEVWDKGRGTVNRQKEQLAAAIDAGREAYYEERSKLDDFEIGEHERPM